MKELIRTIVSRGAQTPVHEEKSAESEGESSGLLNQGAPVQPRFNPGSGCAESHIGTWRDLPVGQADWAAVLSSLPPDPLVGAPAGSFVPEGPRPTSPEVLPRDVAAWPSWALEELEERRSMALDGAPATAAEVALVDRATEEDVRVMARLGLVGGEE